MILSGNPCNFHMLSLNNHTNPTANVFSVVGIKCAILVRQSHTTKIVLYPCTSGNFTMKSALMCLQGFSSMELGINLLFPATNSSFLLTQSSSTFFHASPLLATNCKQQWCQGRDLGGIREGGTATRKLGR